MSEFLNLFRDYLLTKNYSELTIKNYINILKNYLIWYRIDFKSEDKIKKMKAYCSFLIKQNYNPRTINSFLATIDCFYKNVLHIFDDFNRMKVKPRNIKVFTQQELKKIFLTCDNPQHKLILMFAYGSGLTLKEIHNLKFSNIDIKGKKIQINNREVPVIYSTISLLKKLLYSTKNKSNFVFVNAAGYQLNKRSIQKIFEKVCKKARVKHKGIKTLRHSFAVCHFNFGTDLERVRRLMGHVNIKSTRIYRTKAQIN
jgi:site-specific recombinase XerD